MNFEETDEAKSLYDLAPECVRNALNRLRDDQEKLIELSKLSEKELEEEAKPTRLHKRLKVSFWNEFDRAKSDDRLMKTSNIIHKVCSVVLLRDQFLKDPARVFWLCQPPKDYILELESMMDEASNRLREIINMPITEVDAKGNERPNVAAATLVLKAIKQLEDRVRGAPTQKIDQRSMSLNIHSGSNAPQLTSESTEKRIKELEDQLSGTRLSNLEVTDVVEEESSDSE